MSVRETFIDLPGGIAWPIDPKEEVLLWGWDRQLWPHLAKADPQALSKILRKRLRARAFAHRALTSSCAGSDPVTARDHQLRARLYETAANGWSRVVGFLAATGGRAA
jgi:hypothetical protein